jgi:hypothetical protein
MPAAFAARARSWATPDVLATAVLFALLFARPLQLLARDWWVNPEAGHGLLLAPLALWFAWKTDRPQGRAQPPARRWDHPDGRVLRYVSDLAAELFTMRGSMIVVAVGLTVWYVGVRQVLRWWLPDHAAGAVGPAARDRARARGHAAPAHRVQDRRRGSWPGATSRCCWPAT